MIITLKNVKYMASLSEETHCYSADVWADGKKVFGMKNAGHGGEDEVYRINGGVDKVYDVYHTIDDELKKETYKQSEHSKSLGIREMPNCLEFEVCNLVNTWLLDKDIKKDLRKVAYVNDGGVYIVNVKSTPENIERVKKTDWWKDEYKVLNTMPIEDVRQYYK